MPLEALEKGGYEHFMLKEIYEQPMAVRNTLEGRLTDDRVVDDAFGTFNGKNAIEILKDVKHLL